MKKTAESIFNITEFSLYRTVEGQYTDSFIKKRCCVKISEDKECVRVAAAEKTSEKLDIVFDVHRPKTVQIIKVKDSDFAEFIGKYVDSGKKSGSKRNEEIDFKLEEINSDAPAVNIINAICLEAIRRNASDIHIQAGSENIDIRLRIDGVLQSVRKLDRGIFESLVSRVKVMAGLNVMESRLCQDGRMTVMAGGKKLDFRVSIVPSVSGQNIVLRLFNFEKEALCLSQLGFSYENFSKINASLKMPNGMILVTGPTGSGKTTTLHAMLKEMDIEHLKIVTIEDPVENIIEGVEQIQVNEEIGLTFENTLRRILRHDPDVVMVGEIRDRETAELAVRAALTGHLILSTIHTNDSISVITRLKNLGIEPYLISGTLRTSIAQRLVRKTCTECKGKGCEVCSSTGYSGRTAVSEVFVTDEKTSEMIESGSPEAEIKKYVLRKGFTALSEDAGEKIKKGVSTKSEMMREGLL